MLKLINLFASYELRLIQAIKIFGSAYRLSPYHCVRFVLYASCLMHHSLLPMLLLLVAFGTTFAYLDNIRFNFFNLFVSSHNERRKDRKSFVDVTRLLQRHVNKFIFIGIELVRTLSSSRDHTFSVMFFFFFFLVRLPFAFFCCSFSHTAGH